MASSPADPSSAAAVTAELVATSADVLAPDAQLQQPHADPSDVTSQDVQLDCHDGPADSARRSAAQPTAMQSSTCEPRPVRVAAVALPNPFATVPARARPPAGRLALPGAAAGAVAWSLALAASLAVVAALLLAAALLAAGIAKLLQPQGMRRHCPAAGVAGPVSVQAIGGRPGPLAGGVVRVRGGGACCMR